MNEDQIVLAFTPSEKKKDWGLRFMDEDIFYEPYVRFYCTGCEKLGTGCTSKTDGHPRKVGKEPYYNLKTKQIVDPPRIYVTHHPLKGEYEHWKTIDDIKNSPLHKVKK